MVMISVLVFSYPPETGGDLFQSAMNATFNIKATKDEELLRVR
jgi:hypothetical protein